MTAFRKSCVSTIFALSTAAVPMVASAAEPIDNISQVSVQTGDLDLATTRGQAVLQHRLRAAARGVCEAQNPADSAMSDEMLACQGEAMESARHRAQSLVQFAEASRAVSLEASAVPR